MDEGGEGKAIGYAEEWRALIASMKANRADMRALLHWVMWHVWIARGCVLLNVTVIAYDLVCAAWWICLLTPGNVWAAWISLKGGESIAENLPRMRVGLRRVDQQIRDLERLANESGT